MGSRFLVAYACRPGDAKPIDVHRRGLGILALVLLVAGTAALGGEKDEKDKQKASGAPRGIPLTPEQRRDLGERVLSHKKLKGKGPHLKAIRVTLGEAPLVSGGKQTVATVVIFDHKHGKARRVSMDVDTETLLQDVDLPGRPQGSPEEFEEASGIVRADRELALLLEDGGILDGGFIVGDPTGSRHRLMQLKLLSADRKRLLKALTVDLTRGTVASDPPRRTKGGR